MENVLGSHEGLFSVPVEGPDRGKVKQFMTMPVGAETCGPTIVDDGASVFAPSSIRVKSTAPEQPRPSVVVAYRRDI